MRLMRVIVVLLILKVLDGPAEDCAGDRAVEGRYLLLYCSLLLLKPFLPVFLVLLEGVRAGRWRKGEGGEGVAKTFFQRGERGCR